MGGSGDEGSTSISASAASRGRGTANAPIPAAAARRKLRRCAIMESVALSAAREYIGLAVPVERWVHEVFSGRSRGRVGPGRGGGHGRGDRGRAGRTPRL